MAGKGKPREGTRRPKREKDDKPWKKVKRKACIYCKEKIDYVDYKDVVSLRKFASERGKIGYPATARRNHRRHRTLAFRLN